MKVKIVKTYNDEPHFGGSTRDSFYEALVNDQIPVRFVRCDDKNSRYLREIIILAVNGEIMNCAKELAALQIDEDQLIELLSEASDQV
jgi:hypothetical protein